MQTELEAIVASDPGTGALAQYTTALAAVGITSALQLVTYGGGGLGILPLDPGVFGSLVAKLHAVDAMIVGSDDDKSAIATLGTLAVALRSSQVGAGGGTSDGVLASSKDKSVKFGRDCYTQLAQSVIQLPSTHMLAGSTIVAMRAGLDAGSISPQYTKLATAKTLGVARDDETRDIVATKHHPPTLDPQAEGRHCV